MTKAEYKEELIDKMWGTKLRIFYTICLVPILGVFSTPLIWIWDSWDFAWKFGLTCFMCFVGCAFLFKFIKVCMSEAVDKIIKEVSETEIENKQSKFQKRVAQLMEESKQQNTNN